MVLPGTDEAGAVSVAEKLRRAVRETPVNGDKSRFNITASFGVAQIRPGDSGIDECLGRADSALYAAKRSGRDCVMSFAAMSREAALPGASSRR